MRYEWDDAKRRLNLAKHRIDFDQVMAFDWTTALVSIDDREEYGEVREIALGFIGAALHVLAFTLGEEDVVRVIMLRKATRAEAKRYAKARN